MWPALAPFWVSAPVMSLSKHYVAEQVTSLEGGRLTGACGERHDDAVNSPALLLPPVPPSRFVLGVVPATAAARRELAGLTLLARATTALSGSARVGRVVLVGDDDPAGDVLAAALGGLPPGGLVVVHDPLHPLATPGLVCAVLDMLASAAEAVGVVAVRAVTDTLKWVDAGGTVTGTADRERYRVVCAPQAYRAEAFASVLVAGGAELLREGAVDLLPELAGRLGPLLTVAAPQEVFRVADADDLELAAAVLQTGQPGQPVQPVQAGSPLEPRGQGNR